MLSREENKKKKKKPTQEQQAATLLFTPRQVILSNPTTMKQQLKQLTSDQRVLLYHSISHFLEFSGFLKSLSKFRKETHLQKDSWKSCSLNLEEIFQEYLQKRDDRANVPNAKQKDGSNLDASVEVVKGTIKNETDDGKKSNTVQEDNAVSTDDVKSKKKKKKETKDIDSSKHFNGETNLKENDYPVEDVKKSKDKKKKHKDEEKAEKEIVVPQKEKSNIKKSKEETSDEKDGADTEKKSSKKRKKSSSDDNNTDNAEETQTDDSKRRKTDISAHTNGAEQAPKTPKGSADGVLDNGSAKKSEKLNKSKEQNDSTQSKSANAFRRVKADEVEFADDRLQDNSYWAKDGADSGYGAKAQEVLGQVRGRDFRHEKTKKKRGSYRGGQIDLHSHSIKFNYDDDDNE